jgi:hypothetical protein
MGHLKYTRVNHQGRKQTVPGFYASGGHHVYFLLTKLQSLVVRLYNHKFLYMPVYSIMGEAVSGMVNIGILENLARYNS